MAVLFGDGDAALSRSNAAVREQGGHVHHIV
jgi:hypothetical protein